MNNDIFLFKGYDDFKNYLDSNLEIKKLQELGWEFDWRISETYLDYFERMTCKSPRKIKLFTGDTGRYIIFNCLDCFVKTKNGIKFSKRKLFELEAKSFIYSESKIYLDIEKKVSILKNKLEQEYIKKYKYV